MALTLPTTGLRKKLNPLGEVMDTAGQEAKKASQSFKGLERKSYDYMTAPSPFTKENAPTTTGALSGAGTGTEMKAPIPVVQTPQQTAVASMAGRKNVPTTPIEKPDTSIIPVVNAGESLDTTLSQQAISDIHAGMPMDQFDTVYPELAHNRGLFEQYEMDVKAGMPQEEGANMYPELFGKSPMNPAPTTQESPQQEGMLDSLKFKSSEEFGVGEGLKDIGKFFANVPADSAQVVSGIWDAVSSPIQTTNGLVKTAKGLSDTAVYGIANAITRQLGGKEVSPTEEAQMVDAIGSHIKEKYGTAGKFKKAIVENPADTLLTLMGGLGVVNKVAEANNLTNVVDKINKIQKVINPVNILKQEAKLVTAPIGLTGTAIKKTGEAIYKTAIKPNTAEAEKILKFKAGLGEKPITTADTALSKGIAGTETRIGVQALKKADAIFKKEVNPVLDKSKTIHSMDDMFSKAEKNIESSNNGLLRKAELKEGLQALKEEYDALGLKTLTSKLLNQEKSSLDKFTPDKVFKGKPIASSYNEAKNILANVFRNEVHTDLGKFGLKSQEAFRDYANLQELSKVGIKGLTDSGFKGGFGGFWTTMYEQATTPIKTIGGQVLYKVGDKLEFVGPKGINKFGDYLKDKFSIDKKGVLTPKSGTNGNNPINSGVKDISRTPKSVVKPLINLADEKAKAGITKKFPVDLKAEKAKAGLTPKPAPIKGVTEKVNPLDLSKNKKGFIKNPLAKSDDLVSEAKKYESGEDFYQKASKETRNKLKENGISFKSQYEDFYKKNVGNKENIIETVNPTGGLLVKYTPELRVNAKLGPNMTTLDKTMGVSPDTEITIYRGAPKSQKGIVNGDFVTTNFDLAKSYSGEGNVLKLKVKAKDILDDKTDSLGEEYIYRVSNNPTGLINKLDLSKNKKGSLNIGEIGKSMGLKPKSVNGGYNELFHTTTKENAQKISKEGFIEGRGKGIGDRIIDGTFFVKESTPLSQKAGFQLQGDKEIVRGFVSKSAKIQEFKSADDFEDVLLSDKRYLKIDDPFESSKMAKKIFLEKGIDVIIKPYGKTKEYIVINPKVLKSESQLGK